MRIDNSQSFSEWFETDKAGGTFWEGLYTKFSKPVQGTLYDNGSFSSRKQQRGSGE